ncbi:PIN domain-containing protein [uncultured Treponema sp.]|uniref:PIN domain-containing protein n=1 Tax=uncultured Treponema sp. TaxID=162155 RepID=UPI0025F142D7|nr:PIN domain-containing protein [uncultured Treponema sp.]
MVNKFYLLDTNIVSDGSKAMPSELVKEKLDLYSDFCAISSITWYELQKGIKRLPVGRKRDYLFAYVEEQVLPFFEIIGYDKKCADLQSEMFAALTKNGTPLPYQDSQIAATALANGLVLVTRNVKDFAAIQESL